MEFWNAPTAATIGPIRWQAITRHGLYDPDWCMAKVTDGPGHRQLDRIIRDDFARPGFNCLWEWTVIFKFDAQELADRFTEIGHADRLVFRLLPPAPKGGSGSSVTASH
ncbi:hypothetical protein [Streptomyces sp. IMTB 1903]|uniref:hypothetical protein n=1 Tax=Streptomyces sp. IMTB 1903 TaxID=1776680 RepID=UPI000752FE0B|nr:hypothetical protein [Streptomyces sp. IMTB 1903]